MGCRSQQRRLLRFLAIPQISRRIVQHVTRCTSRHSHRVALRALRGAMNASSAGALSAHQRRLRRTRHSLYTPAHAHAQPLGIS